MKRKLPLVLLGIAAIVSFTIFVLVVVNESWAIRLDGSANNSRAITVPDYTATLLPAASPTTPEPVPTATPLPTPEPTPTPEVTPTPEPTLAPEPTPTPIPEPTPAPLPQPGDDIVASGLVPEPPVDGRWISVNLTDGVTRLMDGRKLVQAFPSAWGYGVVGSESDFYATAPGTYYVYSRTDYMWYDWQWSKLWIYGFVGFDPSRANGFHSFLYDKDGKLVDGQLGPVSHGCVRVEDWRAIYEFSRIGMPVVVHGQMKLDVSHQISER